MNENIFKRIYRHLAVPFAFVSFIFINLDYRKWGDLQNEAIKASVMWAKIWALLLCIGLYTYVCFLVHEYYDGEGKRKFMWVTVLLEVLCIFAFVYTSFF